VSQIETYDGPIVSIRGRAVDNRTLAGGLFLVLATQFLTAIMLAAAMVPGYDFRGGAISDLGVAPETALLFNASVALFGLLNVLGGYAYYRVHGKRWLLALFALTGVGAIGVGLFPLDTGAPHSLFAILAFLFLNLQAVGTATRVPGVMKVLPALAGTVGLVFVVLMALGDAGNVAAFGPIGHGGTERMIVYPAMLWLVALGGHLLGQRDSPAASAGRAD
jgi:hypothetical membrane protein